MAKTVCKILGVVLLLVGVCGFVAPTLLGAHLTPAHNVVHLLSGVLALYFGFAGSASSAKGFCLLFGVVYMALGVIGLAKGNIDIAVIKLMLGRVDHLIHILVGVLFLAGGLLSGKSS